MKHWQETQSVLRRAEALAAAGRGACVATVVRISGSAYRRPGAKMLVADDGAMAGSVSGGCLEADVRDVALAVLGGAPPRLVHYDTGGDDTTPFGLGLGCNGAVDVFVAPLTSPASREVAQRLAALLDGDRSFTVVTIVGGASAGGSVLIDPDGAIAGSTGDPGVDAALRGRARWIVGGVASELGELAGQPVFFDVFAPPPMLLIHGAGEDARPLAALGLQAGFRVTVVDHRPAYLDPAHYPAEVRLIRARSDDTTVALPLGSRTYSVVKTHSLAHDREWVRRLLATDAPYIGVLGPRSRIDDILRDIGAEESVRVFGPVGLDLGSEGPEQVAMSIIAELLAVWAHRDPRHLRDRDGVIHAG
jgi:xanthine dehydrogenase accessory factor